MFQMCWFVLITTPAEERPSSLLTPLLQADHLVRIKPPPAEGDGDKETGPRVGPTEGQYTSPPAHEVADRRPSSQQKCVLHLQCSPFHERREELTIAPKFKLSQVVK